MLAIEKLKKARQKFKVAEQQVRSKDYFRAEKSYERLVAEFPGWTTAQFALAQTYLALGKYKEGFRELECRWSIKDPLNDWYKKTFDFDKWWDGSPLRGKTIVVFCEQGLGDAIHFIRYAQQLSGNVIVVAHRPLAPLLDGNVIVADIGQDIALPEYDFVCSAMSLPHILQDFDIRGESYLTADRRITKGVGVVWGGTPGHPLDQHPVTCRCFPVNHFRKLRAHLVSLQLEHRPDLGEPWFPSLAHEIQDARDTAEIMMGLDLVITCDTSTAHLAGALGRPCWLLLPYLPCWRWGIDSESTPWYNSVRIFRQKEPGNWDAVFDEVATQLSAF